MDNQAPAVPDPDDDSEDEASRDVTTATGRVSIRDMRRWGLHYEGGGHIPGLPMQDLDPDAARQRVLTRDELIGILATGYFTIPVPPPEPPTKPAAAPPKRKRARPSRAKAKAPAPAPVSEAPALQQEDEVNHAG